MLQLQFQMILLSNLERRRGEAKLETRAAFAALSSRTCCVYVDIALLSPVVLQRFPFPLYVFMLLNAPLWKG